LALLHKEKKYQIVELGAFLSSMPFPLLRNNKGLRRVYPGSPGLPLSGPENNLDGFEKSPKELAANWWRLKWEPGKNYLLAHGQYRSGG
jgi:hypothetical protein